MGAKWPLAAAPQAAAWSFGLILPSEPFGSGEEDRADKKRRAHENSPNTANGTASRYPLLGGMLTVLLSSATTFAPENGYGNPRCPSWRT